LDRKSLPRLWNISRSMEWLRLRASRLPRQIAARCPHLQIERENRYCLRATGKARENWALILRLYADHNSLFWLEKSLFCKKDSPLIWVGNSTRSPCSTGASCCGGSGMRPKIAKFPVKFPVSREFARRQVRSALRRQPGSHSIQDSVAKNPIKSRKMRAFADFTSVSVVQSSTICERIREVSGEHAEYPVFQETLAGDWRDQHCVVWVGVSFSHCNEIDVRNDP
jgi:hypothetical protein